MHASIAVRCVRPAGVRPCRAQRRSVQVRAREARWALPHVQAAEMCTMRQHRRAQGPTHSAAAAAAAAILLRQPAAAPFGLLMGAWSMVGCRWLRHTRLPY